MALLLTAQSAFAAGTVRVTLPSFPVTLGGLTLSADYSRYPPLVYRGITYLPMTYCDGRLLGLRTDWTAEAGLDIGKNEEPFYEYVREVQSVRNAKDQTAQIAAGKIRVNGKVIDNEREPYPLLLFRDVTYFPLTWRFAVEEFGWDYTFDAKNGLVITNSAAAFETPEACAGDIREWGSMMGTGNARIFCTLYAGVDKFGSKRMPFTSLGLYNMTGKDITIFPATGRWEYWIYRIMGNREELVYRRAIPMFSGEIPTQQWTPNKLPDYYWQGNAAPGTYRLEIVHPEQFAYRTADSQETLYEPVVGDGYAQRFSVTVTIE